MLKKFSQYPTLNVGIITKNQSSFFIMIICFHYCFHNFIPNNGLQQ